MKMKLFKLFAMLACLGAMFCVSGCGSNTPEAVVTDFVKTAQAGKLDQAYLEAHFAGFAEELAKQKEKHGKDQKKIDEEVKKMIEFLNEMAKKEGKDAKFSVVESKVEGDKATVTVKFEKDGKENKEKISVKKVNDKWMIDMK
jgi:ABC-type oligopeptide transport system substrate-binding subunit